MAEALIRQRVEDRVKAIRAKDIDGVVSLYASTIVSFDIVPPLRYVAIADPASVPADLEHGQAAVNLTP